MLWTMKIRPALLASISAIAFEGGTFVPGPNRPTNYLWAGSAALAEQITALLDAMPGTIAEDEMLRRAPDCAAMLEYFDLADALIDGHQAVLKCGEKYLPKFTDEEGPDYETRKKFTKYTNVFGDIIEALSSKPFEEEISFGENTSQDILDFAENVDGSGNNITQFAADTFFNGVANSVDWIFVDFAKPDPNIKTVADEKSVGLQPYWTHVLGRNVLQASTSIIFGKETLVYIRILEPNSGAISPTGSQADCVRIFQRDPTTGIVTWSLYEKQSMPGPDGKTYFVIKDSGAVSIGVIPLVPFATGRRDGRTFKYNPPMRGAADLQIILFRNESALEWNKQISGYPMLAANGIKPDMQADGKTPKKIAVGPSRVLYGPRDGQGNHGTWAYVQPDAQLFNALAADVKETIAQLRELGRQPLTAQSGNITVITAAVAAGKAKSAVQAWAYALKDTLENCMVLTCKWKGSTEEVAVKVYTEFDTATDSIDELPALNNAVTNGTLSHETVREEFQRRGVLGPEWNEDVEKQRLLSEAPADPETPIDDSNPVK